MAIGAAEVILFLPASKAILVHHIQNSEGFTVFLGNVSGGCTLVTYTSLTYFCQQTATVEFNFRSA